MIKKLITKAKENTKSLFFVLETLTILVLVDIILYEFDQQVGSEKGIVFGCKLINLILVSNLLILGLAFIAYLTLKAKTFAEIVRKTLRYFTISIISLIFLIFYVELLSYFFIKITSKQKLFKGAYDFFDGNLYRHDPLLDYAFDKNAVSRYQRILVDPAKEDSLHDTIFIFKTEIKTDSIGNRLIDIPGMSNRKKYAIFFGNSFTVGLGVQDTQNIPYYFAKLDTNFCSYNYAVIGYGPQNMLARLEYTWLKNSIKQDSGVCFYIYTARDPWRANIDMNTYVTSIGHLPYYGYQNDSLHFGSFNHDRWFTSNFYSLMNKSNFIRYLKINFPTKLSFKHWKLTCDIIYKSYLEYKKQFHNDNFYVVIYPSDGEIMKYLKNYKIKTIDLSNLFDVNNKSYSILYDHHPTALANELITKHLLDSINNNKTKP